MSVRPAPSGFLRVATYNVHGWLGTDGRRSVARVVEVIQELDAAIVGLQECELDGDAAGVLQDLRRRTGLALVATPTWRKNGQPFGNAVLTSLPVRRLQRHGLSVAGFEPRSAIDLDLEFRGEAIRVLNTHLGLRRRERKIQGRRLVQLLSEADARSATTLVLCDLNDWRPLHYSVLRPLAGEYGPRRSPGTFPSRRPLIALDRILARPRSRLVRVRAVDSPLARTASDHLPLVADFAPPHPPGSDIASETR